MKKLCMILLLFIPFYANAFKCTINGKDQQQADTTISAKIGNDVSADDKVNILYDFNEIKCFNEDGNFRDDLNLINLQPGPKLSRPDIKSGAIVNGNLVYAPMTGEVKIFSLTGQNVKVPIPMQIFMNFSKIPQDNILIQKNDIIMFVHMRKQAYYQSDNKPYGPAYDFTWTIKAANDVTINTSTCDINEGDPIEVDFGTINPSSLTASGLQSQHIQNKTLTYQCNNTVSGDVSFNIMFDSTPASFSSNAMLVKSGSNYGSGNVIPALGIEMYKDSTVIPPKGSFKASMSNGYGSTALKFAPVKDPNTSLDHSALGAFNAIGVFIVSFD